MSSSSFKTIVVFPSLKKQTGQNKATAPHCFAVVLFVNLFQNTQFYPYYPLSFYFSVTVITQIFFPSQKSQLE